METQPVLALKSFELTDDAGDMWHFEAHGKTLDSFNPPHLNEHMSLRPRAAVVFPREGEIMAVDDIAD